MEKKAVVAIFLCVALGVLGMGVMEWLAGLLGGTPLVVVCYLVIALALMVLLFRSGGKKSAAGGESEGDPEKKPEPVKQDKGKERQEKP